MAPAGRGESHGEKVGATRQVAHRQVVGTWSAVTVHAVGTLTTPWKPGGSVANVAAHITGTVWKIECAIGDAVREGDTVVVLESMKMEMPVESEDAGTVRSIHVEEGQAVREGDALVTLE
jgi:acetyl-CoA carboxylase biotin carboxyl carrier protein